MSCGATISLLVVEKHRQVEHKTQLVAMGIDEEQTSTEHGDELRHRIAAAAAAATDRSRTPTTAQQLDKQHVAVPPPLPSITMNNDSIQRPRVPRSSSRLAHLPRLDSMRTLPPSTKAGGEPSTSAGPLDSIADTSRSSSSMGANDREGATLSDDDTTDGQDTTETEEATDDYSDLSSSDGSTEDEDGTGLSGMPGFLPPPISARRSSSISSEAVSEASGRNSRRPSAIVLPPAPTFTNMAAHTPLADSVARPAAQSASTAQPFSPPTPVAFGRDSWTRFGGDDETPGWLPTPRAAEPATSSSSAGAAALGARKDSRTSMREGQAKTPTGRLAGQPDVSPTSTSVAPHETSYFAIQPAPARNVARGNSNDKSAPPPSPSIISRARARSSASQRPFGTTPMMRELPIFPPVTPLQLRASERAKSPARSGTGKLSVTPTAPPLIVPTPAEASTSPSSAVVPPRPETAATPTSAGYATAPLLSPVPITPGIAEFAATVSAASSGSALRPSLYKQQSRSLIDLTSPNERKTFEPSLRPFRSDARHLPEAAAPTLPAAVGSAISPAPPSPRAPSPAPSFSSVGPPAASMRRRRSMFEVGAAPPPYADVHGAQKAMHIVPREEEGKEVLPHYGCSVHIEGYLPRKMEFSAPGVQAKDRSWRRQYFVLHGTCLRVFRTDLSRENAVSKGDFGFMEGAHVHKEPMNEDGPTPIPAAGSSERPSRLQGVDRNVREVSDKDVYASIAPPTSSSGTTSSSASMHNSVNGSTVTGSSSTAGSGLQRKVEDALSGTISHINHPFSLHKGALVKQYTLQGAESGLAADYLKRRHVVRIRAEGEQFLLQTRNDRHVVDWIEAFQAGTNIAVDLETRPMPKFITLPRRRRRRRREDQAGTAEGGVGGAAPTAVHVDAASVQGLSARELAELNEARRRSLADVQGSRRSSTRTRGDDSPPNPSAAFDDMLREEHENIARQDASVV